MSHTMEALQAAKAALDAVNAYDVKHMLPSPLWQQVTYARGLVAGAIAGEKVKAEQQK